MDLNPTPFIIGSLARAILYGIYIITLVYCFRWLTLADHGWKLRKYIDQRLLKITIFIFLFITTSLGITLRVTIDLVREDKNSARLSVVKIAIENAAILITNGVVIYRCWIVFASKSNQMVIIFIPLVLWFAAFVSAVLIVYFYTAFIAVTPGIPFVFSRLVPPSRYAWSSFYLCDITINIYAMCTMIFRIHKAAAHGSSAGSKQLHATCRILAFFGSLYTITTILSFISLMVDLQPKYDDMRFVLDAINFTMPGITFNLVQIAVHRERAANALKRRPIMRRSSSQALLLQFGSPYPSTLQV